MSDAFMFLFQTWGICVTTRRNDTKDLILNHSFIWHYYVNVCVYYYWGNWRLQMSSQKWQQSSPYEPTAQEHEASYHPENTRVLVINTNSVSVCGYKHAKGAVKMTNAHYKLSKSKVLSYIVHFMRLTAHNTNLIKTGSCFTSSKDDSKFIPKATPIRPNKEREKEPIASCRFRRIITLRWLEESRQHM